MASLWALDIMSSRIFLFPPSPQSTVFFLRRYTSASTVSSVLSPTNVAASSNAASCAAPMILGVWFLPPCAPPTPLTAAPLYLSVLVGGVGFVTWAPSHTSDSAAPMFLFVLLGEGRGGDTWSPSRTPNFSFYVRPGGDWIEMVTRPLLDYVDNLSLVLVMEE